ncbi:MAG: hypothetical protein CMF31_01725 [Kordiimonas sp.]|nr:hypothetical protein [Kordiimonas sp.]
MYIDEEPAGFSNAIQTNNPPLAIAPGGFCILIACFICFARMIILRADYIIFVKSFDPHAPVTEEHIFYLLRNLMNMMISYIRNHHNIFCLRCS